MSQRNFGLLNHFDYASLDTECNCAVCEEWRNSFNNYNEASNRVSDHKKGCRCEMCLDKFKSQSIYLAALSKRDLFSESSFHAAIEPTLGKPYMEYIHFQVTQEKRSRGWWEKRAPEVSLMWWFSNFRIAASALISSGFAVSGVAA